MCDNHRYAFLPMGTGQVCCPWFPVIRGSGDGEDTHMGFHAVYDFPALGDSRRNVTWQVTLPTKTGTALIQDCAWKEEHDTWGLSTAEKISYGRRKQEDYVGNKEREEWLAFCIHWQLSLVRGQGEQDVGSLCVEQQCREQGICRRSSRRCR